MKDDYKTKKQLIVELAEMRQRIAELEASKTQRKKVQTTNWGKWYLVAILATAIATIALAGISYRTTQLTAETVRLMNLSVAIANSPQVSAALNHESLAKIDPAKLKANNLPNRLLAWINETKERHDGVVLTVRNDQKSAVGIAYEVKVKYRIDFPKIEMPAEMTYVEGVHITRVLGPDTALKKILLISDDMPNFRVEILEVSYLNPLTEKTEYSIGFFPYAILARNRPGVISYYSKRLEGKI